jgi:hypothetical protein
MLNNAVAIGRRMNGAEICILVSSVRSSGYEPCTSTHPAQTSLRLILIERSESFLNLLSERRREDFELARSKMVPRIIDASLRLISVDGTRIMEG